MSNHLKLCISICLCIVMLMPSVGKAVYAAEEYWVTLHFDETMAINDGIVYWDTIEIELQEKQLDTGNYIKVDLEQDKRIDLNAEHYYLYVTCGAVGTGETIKLWIGNESKDVILGRRVSLDAYQYSGSLNIRIEREQRPSPRPSYPDTIALQASYDGAGMNLYFNAERIGDESPTITGTGKGYASGEISNLIQITLAFGDGNIGKVFVNGTEIPVPEGTKDTMAFVVKPSAQYDIKVEKSKTAIVVPRTIIWESDPRNQSGLREEELLKHGTMEILDIQDADGNSIGLSEVKQNRNSGWANIVPGSKVILKLEPEYGYQLTSIVINGETLAARGDQSTFEYTMPDTNVHVTGIFERVEDAVHTDSSKVKNGTITLGSSEIHSGSVILSVKDAEPNAVERSNFEKQAEGYTISTYLDIKLNQILYKGSSADVWSRKLETLNQPATITLQLEQGINGEEIVIIHEKQDGTYEILPAKYDAKTQSVTFETTGFSKYAIASRQKTNSADSESTATTGSMESTATGTETGGSETGKGTPKTGDDMPLSLLLLLLAVSGTGCLYLVKEKCRKAE